MDESSTAPATAVGFPPPGSVPLDHYRVRPFDPKPGWHNAAAIMVGLSVEPGARGFVQGLDVTYRVGGRRYHTFLRHEMTLCGYEDVRGECDFEKGPGATGGGRGDRA